jgi:hypothetical protein
LFKQGRSSQARTSVTKKRMNISLFTAPDGFTAQTIGSEMAVFTDLLSSVRITLVALFVRQTEHFAIVSEEIRRAVELEVETTALKATSSAQKMIEPRNRR